ncbi:MAG: tRNA-dihydrouridine synthase family protein [Lachnospiraceae bacterium]|nr:tRNA-dihydrouridine synthase family protein [Lachnospiraceae bacterium]
MKYYFAPLEGVTNHIYRNAYYKLFGSNGIDKFYAPFVSPSANPMLRGKEIADIIPENNNPGINLIPQILANRSDYFIKAATQLIEMGYDKEINLNLGCPSGTVTSKDKGSGFLRHPDLMDSFFEEVFNWRDVSYPNLELSVKTRIGFYDADEFPDILDVYNRYPISELTIHPRTKVQMYKDLPDITTFKYACAHSTNPLVYNGNINSVKDYNMLLDGINANVIMLGRGLIGNPNLVNELNGKEPITKQQLADYLDSIMDAYRPYCPSDNNILFKLKEFWTYVSVNFEDSHKAAKLIRKAQTLEKYRQAADTVFSTIELKNNISPKSPR